MVYTKHILAQMTQGEDFYLHWRPYWMSNRNQMRHYSRFYRLLLHLSSPPVFSGVRVTRSLALYMYVCFVERCLSFCTFSFGHCAVCSSSIYGFWSPLWYLQTLHMLKKQVIFYWYEFFYYRQRTQMNV